MTEHEQYVAQSYAAVAKKIVELAAQYSQYLEDGYLESKAREAIDLRDWQNLIGLDRLYFKLDGIIEDCNEYHRYESRVEPHITF